jgi:hypothetical protein
VARKQPKDIDVTEPTAKTVDNSPVNENPKAPEPAANKPTLKPNQSVTYGGAIRTDH